MTDRYAVAGNPVAHSRSPEIHALFAAQTGQDLVYERLLCPLDDFEATVRTFAAAGGRGCNITVPFKFEAHALARRLSPRARLAGACNVLRFDGGADGGDWFGDNSDGVGLARDIEGHAGRPLRGQRLLLLGAGGAAAGVLASLIERGPTEFVLANRSLDKAQALVDSHAGFAAEHGVKLAARALDATGEGFDILVNGTSASLAGAAVPVPARVLKSGALALDMMYGPAAQPFLDWARNEGFEGRDGLGMLVEQAAEAFFIWRGVMPQTAPVLATLRQRLEAEAGA